MDKHCVKCDSSMVLEDGVWICESCLRKLVHIKRKIWESGGKVVESASDGSCEDECEGVNAFIERKNHQFVPIGGQIYTGSWE